MYAINERAYLDIKVNGKVLPLSGSMLQELTIIQNIQMIVPTLRLKMRDGSGVTTDQFPIVDGAKLEVTIGADQSTDNAKTAVFRVVGAPDFSPGRGAPELEVRAVLDAFKFLSGQPTKSYTGTSSAVVKEIAAECGLQSLVDNTDDSMTWLPFNKRFASFVAMMSDHAWASPSSFYAFGVDERRRLHYRDIDRLIVGQPQSNYYLGSPPNDRSPKPQKVVEYQIKSASAVLNNWVGYGYRMHQTGMDGAAKSYEKVEATRLNNNFDMSRSVQNEVGMARREYAPPDMGNTHPRFMHARHQNKRLRALYGTDIHVMCEHFTDDDLFDLVKFNLMNQVSGESNSGVSGNYVITAKTRSIVGNGYYEKLVLTGQGRQSKNPDNPTV